MRFSALDPKVLAAASQIKLLALDVDGVLTDGKLQFSDQGELFKSFSIKDGLGIKLLERIGIQSAIITGRRSKLVELRCRELGIEEIVQGREDKRTALTELAERLQIPLNEIAYVGDDLPDLGAILSAGLGVTVADAHVEVQQRADWCTAAAGGSGAVRELADMILYAQRADEKVLQEFL